jgi:hypothetical protein
MTRTHCIGLLGIILASFVILTAQQDSARKGRKTGFTSTVWPAIAHTSGIGSDRVPSCPFEENTNHASR